MSDEKFLYRAALTKGEPLRYLSHLDYASLLRRAIVRAKLPAAYSEGFNPHLKMNFASAPAVGIICDDEYMDFELTEPIRAEDAAARLRSALPEGAGVISVKRLSGRHTALMAAADEAVYEITAPLYGSAEIATRSITAFNSAAECVILRVTPKKHQEIDVRARVNGDIEIHTENGGIVLNFSVKISPEGSVKPGEVLRVLCEKFSLPADEKNALIRRKKLLSHGKSPMDV